MSFFGDVVDKVGDAVGATADQVEDAVDTTDQWIDDRADDIGVGGFMDKIESTAKGVGSGLYFVPGLGVDAARTMSDDYSWGDWASDQSNRLGDMTDLIGSDKTITGYALGQATKGMDWLAERGVDRPSGVLFRMGAKGFQEGPDTYFQPENWARSYVSSKEGSSGQGMTLWQENASEAAGLEDIDAVQKANAVMTGGYNRANDFVPFAGDDTFDIASDVEVTKDPTKAGAWREVKRQDPFGAGLTSGTYDVAEAIFLDPTIVGGKFLKGAKLARYGRELQGADAADASKVIREEKKSRQLVLGAIPVTSKRGSAKSRMDAFAGYVDDNDKFVPGAIDNPGGQSLSAYQIYRATPQLYRHKDGLNIAKAYEDTYKIGDDADRVNVRRDIFAATAGDLDAMDRLRNLDEHLADRMSNLYTGRTTGLDLADAADARGEVPFRTRPDVVAEAERQVNNNPELLNLASWLKPGTMRALPEVTASGKRALARDAGKGVGREGTLVSGFDTVDDKAARFRAGLEEYWAKDPIAHGDDFIQTSRDSMPLRILHGAAAASMAPTKPAYWISDKMKTMVNPGRLDLWNTPRIAEHLNTEMRKGRVDDKVREEVLSELGKADSNMARYGVVLRGEEEAMRAYARSRGLNDDMMQDYIRAAQGDRESEMTALLGRGQARTYSASQSELDPNIRVDMVDRDGIPTSTPLLGTQEIQEMTTFPLDDFIREIERDHGRLAAFGKAWEKSAAPGGKTFGVGQNGFYKSKDSLFEMMKATQSWWKVGALARVGYAARNMLDEGLGMMMRGHEMAYMRELGTDADVFAKGMVLDPNSDLFGKRKARADVRAEIRRLEMKVGGDDVAEAALEDAKEVQRLNRKIKKLSAQKGVNNADEIYDLRNRLKVATDQGCLSRNEDLAKLTMFKNALDRGDYAEVLGRATRTKQGAGYREAFGYQLPKAFEGDNGRAHKARQIALNSMDQDATERADRAKTSMMELAGFDTVVPGTPTHLPSWERAINRQIRNSPIAMHVLTGSPDNNGIRTVDEVVDFIKHNPKGQTEAKRVPFRAEDPELWAHDVIKHVTDYLPTQGLREAARQGHVGQRMLETEVPFASARPAVNGAQMSVATGKGPAASALNRSQKIVYDTIGDTPVQHMVRHPAFQVFFRQQQDELLGIYQQNAAKQGRDKLSLDEINELSATAREKAAAETKRALFDVSKYSEMAKTMRFMSPFFAAWQESMKRWGRVIADNPNALRKLLMLWDAPNKAGLVVDEDGNPVESGASVTKQASLVLQMPYGLGGKKIKGPVDIEGPMISKQSINLITNQGGLADFGFGPLVQIPVSELSKKFAEDEGLRRIGETVIPYGPSNRAVDPLIPALGKRLETFFREENSPEWGPMYMTRLQVATHEFRETEGRTPTAKEQRVLQDKAHDQTKHLALLRIFNNATMPFPMKMGGNHSEYEGYRLEFRRMVEQEQAAGKPVGQAYEDATNKFVKTYGDSFFPFTQSSSKNLGRWNPSQESVAASKKYAGLMKKVDPRVYRAVLGREGDGEFDINAYRFGQHTSMDPGNPNATLLDRLSPGEMSDKMAVSYGWRRYNKFRAQADAAAAQQGLDSYKDSESLSWAFGQMRDKLKEDNPSWAAEYNSFNEDEFQDELLPSLETIATSDLVDDTQRPEIGALQDYLAMRKNLKAALEQRDAQGGSADIGAESNADLSWAFNKYVDSIVESSTYFEDYMYSGLIERDPMLSGG